MSRRGPAATAVGAAEAATAAAAELAALIDVELRREVAAEVTAFARALAARAGAATAAVLFYGSAFRDRAGDAALDGVLDFYVLVDRETAWPGPRLAAFANRLLPPNVGYVEQRIGERTLRAKYAVMTPARFRRAMSPRRIDTTLWARFSQPCACVHARSEADRATVRDTVVAAVVTAARWAALLGQAQGEAVAYWRALFERTYASELRVESTSRGADLLGRDPARYARLLPAAWRADGLAFTTDGSGVLAPALSADERRAGGRRWRLRHRLGRPLNLLRLLKAAATFANAIDYVAWKVERHSGYRIEPTAFQRRHPLLAAPLLYARLRARGVLR